MGGEWGWRGGVGVVGGGCAGLMVRGEGLLLVVEGLVDCGLGVGEAATEKTHSLHLRR